MFVKNDPFLMMATYKPSDYELLRRRCAELKEAGWKQTKIAQALGLTQGWVSRTLKKYRQHGKAALAWRKPTGPACRLTQQQITQLLEELNKGAEQHGFPGQIWTRPLVNEVIKRLFGISYDPSQVGRLLKKAEWSRQKPQPKALSSILNESSNGSKNACPNSIGSPKRKSPD